MVLEVEVADESVLVPEEVDLEPVVVAVAVALRAALQKCCKNAKVTKYDNDCGIYCLAQGQDVDKLQSCLTSRC
jgi:hypothetical protein